MGDKETGEPSPLCLCPSPCLILSSFIKSLRKSNNFQLNKNRRLDKLNCQAFFLCFSYTFSVSFSVGSAVSVDLLRLVTA